MICRFLINAVLIFCYLAGISQGGFTKNYVLTNSYSSVCTDVIEAPNGNLIMTGITYDMSLNAYVLTVIGTDSIGNQLWRKNYGNSKFQYLDNILNTRTILRTNNFFYSYSGVRDTSNRDFSVLTKCNFAGDTIWQKHFKDNADPLYINDVSLSMDNGFLITGYIESTGRFGLLIKTDANGTELWRKKIMSSAPNVQEGRRVLQDSVTKKIIMAGYQAIGNSGIYDYYNTIWVMDSLGNLLQTHTVPSACGGIFMDMVQTEDKKFVAVGMVDQCNPFGSTRRTRSLVYKFDLNSITSPMWQFQFDTLSIGNYLTTINEHDDGTLILSGVYDTTFNYGLGLKTRSRLTKLNKNGTIIWNKCYGPADKDYNSKRPKSLNLTRDGGFIMANELLLANNPRPYTITKIDSTGCDSTEAYCRYMPPVITPTVTPEYNFKIYPNPTNGILTIELDNISLENKEDIIIELTDMLGKLVYQLNSPPQPLMQINFQGLTSGVYIIKAYRGTNKIYQGKLAKINP